MAQDTDGDSTETPTATAPPTGSPTGDAVEGSFPEGTSAADATLFPSGDGDQRSSDIRETATGDEVAEDESPTAGGEASTATESEEGADAPDGTADTTESDADAGGRSDAEGEGNAGDDAAAGPETDGAGQADAGDPWLDAERFAEETGINAETPEEAADAVNRLKKQNAGYRELEQIVQQNPGFQQMVAELADGKTVAEAAAALDGVQIEAPDPNENPEAYAEWKAEQKMSEQEIKQQATQQQERRRQVQQKEERMREEFNSLVERHDLSDDQAQTIGETLARLTVTKPGAQFRAKDLEVLRKGLNYDKAIEAARQEGREEALQDTRGDGRPEAEDGLPNMHTAGGGASENEEGSDPDGTGLFGPDATDRGSLHDRV
jgi:hypothetical protein